MSKITSEREAKLGMVLSYTSWLALAVQMTDDNGVITLIAISILNHPSEFDSDDWWFLH